MKTELVPCTWKHGKRWAYTVTFDEALEELFDHTVPLHQALGVPGHVEVVVGHMGRERQIGSSSYNGYHHMGAQDLRRLLDMGWGVGSHSWSHGMVEEDLDNEVYRAKEVLEEAIGCRVVTYVAPGSNANITPTVVAALQQAGYLCAMGVTDDINRPGCDLWFLARCSNLHQGWGPLWSAFDPYHRLAQARAASGWVCDYCHCPSPQIPHENKDLYIDEHRARLKAVLEVGGAEVWLATVEEIVDYILCRRAVQIEPIEGLVNWPAFEVSLHDVPRPVSYRQVTFDLQVPPALCRNPTLIVDSAPCPAMVVGPDTIRTTLDLAAPRTLILQGAGQ